MKNQTHLSKENTELKARLAEAEELLAAIRSGTVDAFVTDDQKVFTLKSADHAYRVLVETMNEGAATLMLDGTIMYCNGRLMDMLGLPVEKIIGSRIFNYVETEAVPKLKSILQRSRNEMSRNEFRIRNSNGTFLSVLLACSSLKLANAGLCMVITDLTEQKIAADSMRAALREKEIMLQEIHHRVKNNLQTISSLLHLQAISFEDKKISTLLIDSQERVKAMAMVHEYLYKSPDLAHVNFPSYVAGLVRNLDRTYGLSLTEHPPDVRIDKAEISMDAAVSCGLLLTELISNSAKYAYSENKGGPLEVRFRNLPDDSYELSVADEGRGFPVDFDWVKSNSLGLRLVRLLTDQLHGKISLERRQGVKFVITFKDNAGGGKH